MAKFVESKKIGKLGEAVVFTRLAQRRHWNSPKDPALKGAITISSEHIMCQAQIWTDKSEEHQHNKDFTVSANACKKCKFIDCQYREYEPYPEDIIEQRHEVKTNNVTHNREFERANTFSAEKDFSPTGNLFIEYYSNVTKDNPTKKPGWFKQEQLATWYHFYQPIQPPEQQDISDDEKKRFQREMTVRDKLIPNKQFGYIISITGKKLKEIEPILCQKDRGAPKQFDALNEENGTVSRGTAIPVAELLNNPLYFNKNQHDILFTPKIDLITGTKESTESVNTYYLPKAHFERLPQLEGIDINKVARKTERVSREKIKQTVNGNLVWFRSAEFLVRPDSNSKWIKVELGDGWTVYDQYGNIKYIGDDAVVDGSKIPELTLGKRAQFAIEALGQKIYPIGDKQEKAYMYKFIGEQKSSAIYESINTKPYVAILKSTKSWG